MEVLTEVGSLVLRVYILRALWTALYAQNAAPLNLPLHSMITYATVAMLMSLILEVDGTRMIREKVREGDDRDRSDEADQRPALFFQRRHRPDAAARPAGSSVAAFRAAARAHRRAVADDVRRLSLSFAVGYGVNFFLNFLMNCDRVLDARDVRRPADRAMGLRLALRTDHSADALSRASSDASSSRCRSRRSIRPRC